MLSMTSAVNSVIGINDSHRTTTSGNCTFEIMIKGIIRINSVTIPHNKISINMFSYHRSIITPNAAEIVAAINIARYEGINILSDNIITMTAIMSTM